MADKMSAEQRSRCMSRIRSTNTKPEMIVRKWLWSHGYRYGLHNRNLPGKPDIVLRKYKTVIQVNGCFWHGHNAEQLPGGEIADSECCRIPHSNRGFWLDKINRNMQRDAENVGKLKAKGWRVIVIWECDLRPKRRQQTLENLLMQLNPVLAMPESKRIPVMPEPSPYSLPEEGLSVAAEPDGDYSPPDIPSRR